jgi:acyl-CoA synthetase (NDP forming)
MPGIAEVISKHLGSGKPVIPVMLGGGRAEAEERQKLAATGIPVYGSPCRGAKVLAALLGYAEVRGRGLEEKSKRSLSGSHFLSHAGELDEGAVESEET